MSVIATRDQVPHLVRAPGALPAHRPAATAGPGVTFQDATRIVRKRKWLIVLAVTISVAVSAGVTALWAAYKPFYTAEALLGINPPEPALNTPGYMPAEYADRMKMTQMQVAQVPTVLDKTIKDDRVMKTTWYRKREADAQVRLKEDTAVQPVRETNWIRFSMTGEDKEDLAEIVNVWCEIFMEEAKARTTSGVGEQKRKYLDQQTSMRAALTKITDDLKTLPNDDEQSIKQMQADLGQQLNESIRKLGEAQAALNEKLTAKNAMDNWEREHQDGLLQYPEVNWQVANDPLLRNLNQMVVDYRMQYESFKGKVDDNHRMMRDLRGRIDGLQKQLDEREIQFRDSFSRMLKDRVTQAVESARLTVNGLQAKVEEINVRRAALDADLKTVRAKREQADALKKDLEALDRKLLELTLLEKGQVPVFWGQKAIPPKERSMPKWKVMLPVGGLLGLVIGLVLAFVLELMDPSIKDPTDIARRMDLPLLGKIPHAEDLDEEIPDLRLAFLTHPNSLIDERFHEVRTMLQFSAPASQLRSILIASPLPDDGRSTVALNLAAATAHSRKKVLVVEANFRRPVFRSLFPQLPEGGLSNALVGQSSWKDLVREVQPNLYALTSGPLPPNPSELLGSPSMKDLLQEFTAEYDQVFFDGAPCVLFTDSSVLSTLVDGVILVVRAKANTHGVVQRAKDLLALVGAKTLGVVLNDIHVTAGGYLRKDYRTFYEYQPLSEGEAHKQLTNSKAS